MNSLILFAVNPDRLASFYSNLLSLEIQRHEAASLSMEGGGASLLFLQIPAEIARDIPVQTPPMAREESAIKPAFDVMNLARAIEAVTAGGGVITPRNFISAGSVCLDVLDPEGNVIQLRCPQ
jgi:predicted enzyme related to lactoylglutathione lyase